MGVAGSFKKGPFKKYPGVLLKDPAPTSLGNLNADVTVSFSPFRAKNQFQLLKTTSGRKPAAPDVGLILYLARPTHPSHRRCWKAKAEALASAAEPLANVLEIKHDKSKWPLSGVVATACWHAGLRSLN